MRPVLCFREVLQFFKTSQSFDQITTLTYILMDNFLSLFSNNWTFLYCSLFGYRCSNFAIAKVDALILFVLHILYQFCVHWLIAIFLYYSPHSYRPSNYCNSHNYQSFSLLKEIAKRKWHHFAIAFKREKEW